jgi:hypothetical protein
MTTWTPFGVNRAQLPTTVFQLSSNSNVGPEVAVLDPSNILNEKFPTVGCTEVKHNPDRNRASDCADQHAISCCLFEKLTALLRDFLMDYDPRFRVGQGHEVRFSNLSFGARKRKEWSRRLPWRSLKQFRKSSDPSRLVELRWRNCSVLSSKLEGK